MPREYIRYNIIKLYTVELKERMKGIIKRNNQRNMDSLDTNVDMVIEDLEIEDSETEQDEFLNSKDVEKEFDNDLLNYALHYARSGYPVHPLQNLIKKMES